MRRDARVVTRAVADAEADEDGKPRARLVRGADGKFVREGSEGGGLCFGVAVQVIGEQSVHIPGGEPRGMGSGGISMKGDRRAHGGLER